MVSWAQAQTRSGPLLIDTRIGQNGDPAGKIQAFETLMADASGQVDVALMKFCYDDFRTSTDVVTLFNQYAATMDRLERAYPRVTFLYGTAAVRFDAAATPVAPEAIDSLVGLDPADLGGAAKRELFNSLIRQRWGSTGRVFDVAALESRRSDGRVMAATVEGRQYYTMNDELRVDAAAHLNAQGSEQLARELMTVVGSAID